MFSDFILKTALKSSNSFVLCYVKNYFNRSVIHIVLY